MSDLKLLAAQAALTKMLSESHFSICTIDSIVKMNDLKPDREAMAILKTLHCVDYNQMPHELLGALPDLIARVLQSPNFDASKINIVETGTGLKLVKH